MALNNNAININAGFEIGSGQPIDSRQLLTKAQMLSIDENIMPSKYFCVCSDDGLLYTYDANNEVDEELGKFRVASGLEVIRLTQAEYNQMVEDGEIEDKFYLITDAPNSSMGGASSALELTYDNTASELNATNVQDAIDEVNEKTDAKLDKVESMPTTPLNNDTVLFLGATTDNYTKGHIYQYQTNEWVDLSPEEGIDEEARETATGAMALATAANEKAEDAQTAIDEVNEKVESISQDASGISYDNTNSGLAAVNTQYAIDEINEKTDTKLDKVTTIPATPSDGDTVLFIGTNTNDYKKGHTYQYQTNEWVDITATEEELVSGAIGLAQVANEKAEEAITTISNKLDKATIVTQAEYNQLIEDGEIEDKFYIISDADSSGGSEIKDASDVDYDNTSSGLTATDTQAAIDEVNEKVENISQDASEISYDNTNSGLIATNTQGAIDELNTKVNNIPDAVVPKGTVAFANLPSLASVEVGWMYNISDDFTTTSDFVTLGVNEKAGSNVYCIEVSGTKKWDVFAVADSIAVDQTYNATSTNPQSGTAVAQAIAGLSGHYTISYSNGIATLTAI